MNDVLNNTTQNILDEYFGYLLSFLLGCNSANICNAIEFNSDILGGLGIQ